MFIQMISGGSNETSYFPTHRGVDPGGGGGGVAHNESIGGRGANIVLPPPPPPNNFDNLKNT